MPKLNSRGDVAHGIGGGHASLNNARFGFGGVLGWKDDDTISFANGDDAWIVSTYHVPSKAVARVDFNPTPSASKRKKAKPLHIALPQIDGPARRSRARSPYQVSTPANQGYAGGGHVHAWLGSTDINVTGVYSTTGFRRPLAGLLQGGYDGEFIYKPLYQSYGPTHIRTAAGDDQQLLAGHADFSHPVGQGRVLFMSGMQLFSRNLPPCNYEATAIWKAECAHAAGKWWVMYYSALRGLTLHPFDSFVGYSILPKGDGWHTIRELSPNIIRIAISTTEGEQPGQIWMRDVDVANGKIRDPWGANTWATIAAVDVRTINPPAPEPIPTIDNGWFPRLSRAGQVVSGTGFVTFRGKKIFEPGYSPRWLVDGESIVAQGAGDKLYALGIDGSNQRVIHDSPVAAALYDAGAGKHYVAKDYGTSRDIWVNVDPITGTVVTVREHKHPGNPNRENNDRDIVVGDAVIVAHSPVNEARSVGGFVVWRDYVNNTKGYLNGGVIDLRRMKDTWEGNPIPIQTNEGWWFSFMTNEDLRYCPIGSTQGYIIKTGEDKNFTHDSVGMGNKIRTTWNTNTGARFSQDLDLSAPRVDVTTPLVKKPVDPEPEPAMTYRDFGGYFVQRWNELGIPAKMDEITRRNRVTRAERTFLKTLAAERRKIDARPLRMRASAVRSLLAKAPTKRTLDLEEEYKAVQCPAVALIAGELFHTKRNKDIGLSTKNGGNRWTLPDGRNMATDIITIKPTDGNGNVIAGNFTLADVLTSGGSADTKPGWSNIGPNNDPSRPWMEPPLPEGIEEPGPVDPDPSGTHRFDGGGNDFEPRTCDTCGKPPSHAVHQVPEGKVKHKPWLGEDGRGDCDLCFKPVSDAIHNTSEPEPEIHRYTPARADVNSTGPCVICGKLKGNLTYHIEEEPEQPPVDKHEFVGSERAKFCEECGKARTDAIHQMPVPEPGAFNDARIVAGLTRIENAINNQTTQVVSALKDVGSTLPDIFGGLGGILNRTPKKTKKR